MLRKKVRRPVIAPKTPNAAVAGGRPSARRTSTRSGIIGTSVNRTNFPKCPVKRSNVLLRTTPIRKGAPEAGASPIEISLIFPPQLKTRQAPQSGDTVHHRLPTFTAQAKNDFKVYPMPRASRVRLDGCDAGVAAMAGACRADGNCGARRFHAPCVDIRFCRGRPPGIRGTFQAP